MVEREDRLLINKIIGRKNMETYKNAEFTKDMRKTHTIYMPQMLHYHNELLQAAFKYGGYNLEIVPEQEHYCRETFSYINKDYCTCATSIIGNLLTFIQENEDLVDKIAVLEPQAGGACRAGNYYNLIIACLHKSGYKNIPVLSLNFHGQEKHSGFTINPKMLFGAIAGVCYSDLLMTLTQQIKPYEVNSGETEKLRKHWLDRLYTSISNGKNIFHRIDIYNEIVSDFKKVKIDKSKKKTKVGVVGEIYIKFSPIGNCHLEEFLSENDCDYRYDGFINYCIFVVYSEMKNMELSNKSGVILKGYKLVIDYLCNIQKSISKVLADNDLKHDMGFYDLLKIKNNILSDYYDIGDGWLMTAEIMDMIEQGYNKILIVHPFGCLVSHVGGRGIIKAIEEKYPNVKVSSIEYDFEQSKTLRESRIMLAIY